MFAGIGCQEQGIKDTGMFDLEVKAISEIDKYAILAYAAVHCGLTKELINTYAEYPSTEEMVQELVEGNIGYDFKKDKAYDWGRVNVTELKTYWLAYHLSHCMGDISKIDSLPYADLWTISFPCTDISAAGALRGFSPDSKTRSSLLWENIRLLHKAKEDNMLPKYLLFENVKNLVSKRFRADFNTLLSVLEDIGFNSYWSVINAVDCDVPQSRERVFVVCIRKDIDVCGFVFPKACTTTKTLRDVLDTEVDAAYYVKGDNVDAFVQSLDSLQEGINAVNTCANGAARTLKAQYFKNSLANFKTEGGFGATAAVKVTKNKRMLRKLTPTECWRLMGWKDTEIRKAIEIGVSPTQLYKQAGNGIVTECVRLLMERLIVAQYDSGYIPYDERTVSADVVPEVIKLGNIYPSNGQNGNVYSPNGVSPTLVSGVTATQGNGGIGSSNAPKILVGDD